MNFTYSHINLDKRCKIARRRMAGISVEIIAEKLGRHRSPIWDTGKAPISGWRQLDP
jgi:IS30 family transposase